MRNNIILIGFMGCGKSTIGRLLSEKTGYEFMDTDLEIEQREGRTISSIFEKEGEEYFRNLETQVVEELLTKEKGLIVSVGGGLPVRSKNREILLQLGIVIYLKTKPETIYERVKEDTGRPLLQTEDPKKRIKEMMQDREEKYREASHYNLWTDEKNPEEIMEEILGLLKNG